MQLHVETLEEVHAALISEIEAYCARTGMSESAFGRKAVGDSHFLAELRGGRDLRGVAWRRVMTFLRQPQQSAISAAQPQDRAA